MMTMMVLTMMMTMMVVPATRVISASSAPTPSAPRGSHLASLRMILIKIMMVMTTMILMMIVIKIWMIVTTMTMINDFVGNSDHDDSHDDSDHDEVINNVMYTKVYLGLWLLEAETQTPITSSEKSK